MPSWKSPIPTALNYSQRRVGDSLSMAQELATQQRTKFPKGYWIRPGKWVDGPASTISKDRLYLWMWDIPERVTLDQICGYVTTAAAIGSLKVNIWAAEPSTNRPYGDPISTEGSISLTGAGIRYDTTIYWTLDPGVYWVGTRTHGVSGSPAMAVGQPVDEHNAFASIGEAWYGTLPSNARFYNTSSTPNLTGVSLDGIATLLVPAIMFRVA